MNYLFTKKSIQYFVAVLLITQSSQLLSYDEATERRISIGLRLFRTLLASDSYIKHKISLDNQLNVLIVCSEDSNKPESISEQLINIGRGTKKGKIHGFPINISIIVKEELNQLPASKIAGIYIADKLSDQQLEEVIKIGISHQVIVYSPFEGDVEKGVPTGLAIGIRVLPYVNLKALKKSDVTIKSLILKVAKIYED